MSVSVFYVDAHNGITDAQNVWANDANAFNGDITSSATTTTPGGATNNALTGLGTNADIVKYTGPITQVRTRIFGTPPSSSAFLFGYVTGGPSALSGGVSPFVTGTTTASWGAWVNMNVPSGGWTWQKVKDIKGTFYSSAAGTAVAYQIQVEVTFDAPKAETFIHSFPGTTLDTSVWTPFTFGTGVISVSDRVMLEYNGGSTNSASITSKVAYDLSSSYLYFKMDVNAAGGACGLTLTGDLYLVISGTDVKVYCGGAARITYAFSDQALYFKVRESASTFYLDTSVDNVTYTNRGSFSLVPYGHNLVANVIQPYFWIN